MKILKALLLLALVSAATTVQGGDYFPLTVGNWWQYSGDDPGYMEVTGTTTGYDSVTGFSGLMYAVFWSGPEMPDTTAFFFEWTPDAETYICVDESGVWCLKDMQIGDQWYETEDSTVHTVVGEEMISVPAGNFWAMKVYWEPNVHNDGEYSWWVDQVGFIKDVYWMGTDTAVTVLDSFQVEPAAVNNPRIETQIPMAIYLFPPAPNPFNPTTVASFELRVPSHVALRVYDLAGRLVTILVDGWRETGEHRVTWDASGLPSGVYLLQLQAGEQVEVRKAVLMK